MIVSRIAASDVNSKQLSRIGADTLMCSLPFATLWEEMGGLPVWWIATQENEVIGGLPGVEFGRGVLKRFQAMPDGCYSRLCIDARAGGNRNAICREIVKGIIGNRYAKVFIYDFFDSISVTDELPIFNLETTLVDISQEWEPPDKKIRSEIRKAEREGIEIQAFDRARQMESFLSLMEECERRHGRKPKYPRQFFERLAELAEQDDRVIWKWCEHEGKPAASHILLVEGDMALHWQVYFDKSFSFLKPNQVILQRAARELAAVGVRTINLGASPPDAEGLQTYKGKWGGRSHAYRCYQLKSGIGKLL